MRIGSSIALIAIGLILALAVNVDVEGLDLQQIGWILAVVGTVGLIISVVMARRTRPVVAREAAPPVGSEPPYGAQPVRDPRYPDPGARY
jgi:Domain of unknown function (DUF6458)